MSGWKSFSHQDQQNGFRAPAGESAGHQSSQQNRHGVYTSPSDTGNKEFFEGVLKNLGSYPYDTTTSFGSDFASAEQFETRDQGKDR